ncbi:MAG: amino acid adenylation domain-containing protein [Acaryochloris sp. RU_4_1]|nr:amino acid adenylation domain-containing protein [Acaryochloris sp. RU_4_1]NJR53718.1 amino acid adenylation domain-containing protein [Acaryochloris sp. CRU_2_0]
MSNLQTQPELNAEQQKQALLKRLLQAKGIETFNKKTIPRRSSTSPCPLSFAQERLWFLVQLESNSPAYHIPCTLRIKGVLRLEILKRCFVEIQQRHEILRTHFTQTSQQPLQVIEPGVIATLPMIELQHLPPAAQEAEIHRLAQEESQKSFDLEQGPLFRLTVLRLDTADHVLLFTLHHIISDAWSSGILIQEFSSLYEAFNRGNPSPLPELPIQYADFAIWQRECLQGEALDAQLTYWRQQLKDAPPVLALPTDRPRPAIQRANGAIQSIEFPPHLSQALQDLAQKESVTLYMMTLAAFKVLLYRYTGQTNLVVGSAIANRNRPEIEGLIGFFVNTLVLRTQLSGNSSFKELLSKVRKVTLDAYEHQDFPFEKLVAELNIERNLSYQPLFQVAFELQNFSSERLQASGLTFEFLDAEVKNAKYDLTLLISETAKGLAGSCEYNTDLFDPETITQMLGHYQVLLESIVTNPGQSISALPLLTTAEQHQLLVEWNNTEKPYSTHQTVHQLFEEQVERTPDAIAIVCGNQSITYQDLNIQANQTAHYLTTLGVQEDTLVGICFEKNIDIIIALLGVLKACGAYVPIDPAYPQHRVIDILDNACLKIILTQENLTHRFEPSVQTICLNASEIAQQSRHNPNYTLENDRLSYIIYTSGSTGKPKGVMIEHRSLVNYTQAAIENYGITAKDRILQFASISFDAAAEEIFPALAKGATLILRTEEMLSTIPTFLNHCLQHKLTVLDLPTAFWHLLVTEMKSLKLTLPESVRLVIIGGEAASPEHLISWQKLAPTVRLVNSYGPTEATIVATTCELSAQLMTSGNTTPIGKPIPNVQAYVLDDALQPVPIGVPGELYIAGAGLARGYLHQPELTAKVFIPNPLSTDPDARLYRTGDQVRYCKDGNLEFLGRLDEQVKIRGFRIELGEIAAVLNQHPALKNAIALDQNHEDEQRLVAYLVPEENCETLLEQNLALDIEQMTEWQTVFDDLYHAFDPQQQSGFYIKGWESSYTHQPIPDKEVQVWMEQTVQHVKQLNPNRVLELGCGGSGLMLLQIAPQCSQYWATDPSANALNILQQQLQHLEQDFSAVTFSQRSADDFTGVQPGSVDTVLIVSVAQYFPSIDYLVNVLKKAVDALEPGGFIFLGDVRNLDLLEAFYAAFVLRRSPDNLCLKDLRHKIQNQIRQEKQLVIAPAFFYALKDTLPVIDHVEIHLERGIYQNELTQFRYDVVLHKGAGAAVSTEIPWIDWQAANLSVEAVENQLKAENNKVLGLMNIPNFRVSQEIQTIQALNRLDQSASVGDLRQTLQDYPIHGIDPEDLWQLGNQLPYRVEISWSAHCGEGQYNAVFKRHASTETEINSLPRVLMPDLKESDVLPQSWRHYANKPKQTLAEHQLILSVQQYLGSKLPSYMVPSAFVCLDSLPLNTNGKVDRQALPIADEPISHSQFLPPRTVAEEVVAEVWKQVLGLQKIGVRDNFFELGGHSLLATRVISQLRQDFQVELPLRALFESPTVEGLVNELTQMWGDRQTVEQVAEVLKSMESLSADEISQMLSEP